MTRTLAPALLEQFGFTHNPFDYPVAERQPDDLLQQTYCVDETLVWLMLDEKNPAVFLAEYGGGKTAARYYVRYRWRSDKTKTFLVEYTQIGDSQNSITDINMHRRPLLNAIAQSAWHTISEKTDLFLKLPEHRQFWWWALMENYLPGALLVTRVPDFHSLLPSYRDFKCSHILPFRNRDSIEIVLDEVSMRISDLGYQRMLILVDEVDGRERHHKEDLEVILSPVFNTLSLFRKPNIVWKFFLPIELKEMIEKSSAFRRESLELAEITWGESNLRDFLTARLEWASEEKVRSLNQLSQEGLNFDLRLIHLILENKEKLETFGTPRALLWLGRSLFDLSLYQGLQINKSIWDVLYTQHLPTYLRYKTEEQKKISQQVEDTTLQNVICTYFDLEEVRIHLCLPLNIEYEDLRGTTRPAKANALIKHCKRNNQVTDLILTICEKRPHVHFCEESTPSENIIP